MQMSVEHRKAHFYRVEIIAARIEKLCLQILEFDGTARYPAQRDLTYALRKCPLYMVKRYRRLCNIQSRYRCAYL